MTDPPVHKRIAVLQLARLGDILMTLPLIASLARKQPEAEIQLFVHELFANLLPESPVFRVVPIPFNTLFETLRRAGTMEQALGLLDEHLGEYLETDYDLVLNCSGLKVSAILASLLRAKERRGMLICRDESLVNSDPGLSLFTKYETGRRVNWVHQVEIFLSGVTGTPPTPLHACKDELFGERIERFMGERRIMDRYVLIFPGASIPEKEIGRDLLSVMVRILLQDTEYKVILAGRENDRVDMPLIGLDRGRVEDWSGKTDLAVLFNLVAHAECVICNDSGPMHAAALLNKKNIVISTGAAFFPETTGYNDDVLVFVPEADCYPCPWIGYPCSKGFSCKVQFDPEWVSSWMLHYLRKGGRPLSGGKNKAYRTMIDTVKGLTFVPCGDNVLYGAEWAGLIYQSFWKERLLGLNAETVLEALLRPYQGISDKLTDQIAAFRGELEKGSRLSDHLLHAFALLEKYHNKSFVTAIQEGIEALFQWSEQDSLLAPVLQYHKMAYHSAVFGHGEALLGAYYGNTIRLKKDMDRLRELIAVFQSHYLMKQCGYKDGECLADAFSETALP